MTSPAYPPPCHMVNVTRLPPELKRKVWAFVKAERPQTAAVLTGMDPDSPIAQLAGLLPESSIWLPVTDCGLSDAELGSLSVSMVSFRGTGISLPTPMRSTEADSCSASAPRANTRRARR